MSNIAKLYPQTMKTNYFGAAKVVETNQSDGILRVRVALPQKNTMGWARLAIAGIDVLQIEDEVLIAGEDINHLYVIGILSLKKRSDVVLKKQEIGNGAYTVTDKSSTTPMLRVFSKRNELIFEYDPISEKTCVNIESGHLEFTTRKGDIIFNAEKNIKLKGQIVDISSKSGIKLAITDAIGQLKSSFSLQSHQTKLSSPKFSITAKIGELQLANIQYVGNKFLGKVKDSQLFVGKLSTVAKSITEKSQNVYRTVEQLTQLKTGRMRTLVTSTFHFKAKNSYMKSEEDFKIKADKIHLG